MKEHILMGTVMISICIFLSIFTIEMTKIGIISECSKSCKDKGFSINHDSNSTNCECKP